MTMLRRTDEPVHRGRSACSEEMTPGPACVSLTPRQGLGAYDEAPRIENQQAGSVAHVMQPWRPALKFFLGLP